MHGVLPTTLVLCARLTLDPSPAALPWDWTGNVYGSVTPEAWIAVGAGPLELCPTPQATAWVSLAFHRGVGEEGDIEVIVDNIPSFTIIMPDPQELTLTTLDEGNPEVWGSFVTPPVHVDFGPVNVLRHMQSARTTVQLGRDGPEYVLLIRSVQDPSDFNRDGQTTDEDFYDFITTWCGVNLLADVNFDGVVDSQDFFEYVTEFLGA